MVTRKRGREEMESSEPATELSLLDRLQSMWEFSNLMQYIFIFGKAVKIDEDVTIEVKDLETECLKPEPSQKLADIGLALLKFVSSHRGLTPELFDEYTRRQYMAKAPGRNPFGTEETPNKFADFDVFTKLRVLFQLSQWTLINAERMRGLMPEGKDSEQTQWRIEEIGYDKQERLYFVLDDNRMYRRTDPQLPLPPPPKPKANSRKGKAAARASQRRKTANTEDSGNDAGGETGAEDVHGKPVADDGFGGRKWECIAITLGQYQEFLETIQKSRDPDEKALHRRITLDVVPIIEKAEEAQLRTIARRERELMNQEKLATAKRSSRLASKMDKEREAREAMEAEQKRKAVLTEALKDQERQKKMDEARESRMMTREQRLKEREYKRILHEEELATLSEDNKKLDAGEARLSERHLKAEMEKKKKELAALAEDDVWFFDCSKCGVHGENLDDGSHSIACEKCNVWQHSACHGISQGEAEKDNFHFICRDCQRREEDAKKPKIAPLKFHIGSSSSPPSQTVNGIGPFANQAKKRKSGDEASHMPPLKKFKPVEGTAHPQNPFVTGSSPVGSNGMHKTIMNGPTLSPQGQLPPPPHQRNRMPNGIPPPPGLRSPPAPPAYSNGYTHYVGQQNGYNPKAEIFSHISPPTINGAGGNSNKQTDHGWSASYSPPQPPAPPYQTSQYPSSGSPYLNSFPRQNPSSSHTTNKQSSPSKANTITTPSQSNQSSSLPTFSPHPHRDGSPLQQLPPVLQPPSHSPIKQQSSPPAQPTLPPSSTPTAPPPLQQRGPSPPGLSPTKHSPPRPAPPPGHDLGASAPVIHPVSKRSSSPQLQQQDSSPPGLSPTKHSPPRLPPSPGYGIAGTPVVPPVPLLEPSPGQQQGFRAPIKSTVNGEGSGIDN